MGKQGRFFMGDEDEDDFLGEIRRNAPYQIIRTSYPCGHERVIASEDLPNLTGDPSIYNLALVRESDADKVVHRVSHGDTCHVDLGNSHLIQFNRCQQKSAWLSNGRLWFQESRLVVENRLEKKDNSFCEWAATILQWIKRQYAYLPEQFCYAGPGAKARTDQGLLQLGPPQVSSLSLEERKNILGL